MPIRHFIFVQQASTGLGVGKVVGFAEGTNAKEALDDLLNRTCPFLLAEDVDSLVAWELASPPVQHGRLSGAAYRREHPDLVAEIRRENRA